MHIKKAKGSPMLSVIEANVKHKSHGHGHMGNGGVLHNGMSLFQDLKLKRRKVDSRCSSDGESIGTSDSSAASLSPDAQTQGEGSPKEKDRCRSPEEMVAPTLGNGKSPSNFQPQAFLFMVNQAKEAAAYGALTNGSHQSLPKTNGVIKPLNGLSNGNHVVVKSEPSDEEMDTSTHAITITPAPMSREGSPNGHTHETMELQHSGDERRKSPMGRSPAGSDCESTTSRSSSVIKREKLQIQGDQEHHQRSPPPLVSLARSPGQISTSSSSGMGLSPQSNSSLSPPSSSSTLTITKQGGPRRSPNASPPQHYMPHYREQLIGQQNLLHSRLTGPSPDRRIPSPMVQGEMRSIPEKPDPLSVVTSTSLSFHHQSPYRINGVRPEVISGGAVTPTANGGQQTPNGQNQNSMSPPSGHHHQVLNGMRKSPNLALHSRSPNSSPQSSSGSSMGNGSIHSHSPNSTIVAGGSLAMPGGSGAGGSNSHHHHVNLNRTPTVIMGEAGGVRTMLWSQPGQNLPPELGGVNNAHSPPSNTNGHYGLPPTNGHLPNHHGPMSNGGSPPHLPHHHNNNTIHHLHQKGGLSMERLWASEALNLSTSGAQGSNTTNGNSNSPNGHATHLQNGQGPNGMHPTNGHHIMNSGHPEDEDFEQPMICMICEDRATGLHYGIITCEGCKGFFKRTVQNRRVYTCVADGTCEITKAQRNRCQYCRFKKCIEQGMVLQAVREDRMPGGRNSGAVYNLYKVPVKYRKHKKTNRGVGGKAEKINLNNNSNSNGSSNGNGLHHGQNGGLSNGGMTPSHAPPPQGSITGTILKAALTSPNEVNHMRQGMPFDQAAAMITHLVQCDNFHDIAALQNWEELLEARGELSDKLCQMGDSIVYRLVQWTKRLPFYQEVPVDVHTRILTHKWHELLVLTTSAWQAMHTPGPPTSLTVEEETMENLQVLQRCLQAMMGRSLTLEQLRTDVGQMVERLTHLTRSFRRIGIRIEEYVVLKVIAMLQNTGTKSNEVAVIQERHIKCLRTFLEVTCPNQPNRLGDLLRTLPEVQAAAALLLESKMFYVPFLLNSALLQR